MIHPGLDQEVQDTLVPHSFVEGVKRAKRLLVAQPRRRPASFGWPRLGRDAQTTREGAEGLPDRLLFYALDHVAELVCLVFTTVPWIAVVAIRASIWTSVSGSSPSAMRTVMRASLGSTGRRAAVGCCEVAAR